jgi:hypothetical protein
MPSPRNRVAHGLRCLVKAAVGELGIGASIAVQTPQRSAVAVKMSSKVRARGAVAHSPVIEKLIRYKRARCASRIAAGQQPRFALRTGAVCQRGRAYRFPRAGSCPPQPTRGSRSRLSATQENAETFLREQNRSLGTTETAGVCGSLRSSPSRLSMARPLDGRADVRAHGEVVDGLREPGLSNPRLQALVDRLGKATAAAKCLADEDEFVVHLRYPTRHRRRCRSTNLLGGRSARSNAAPRERVFVARGRGCVARRLPAGLKSKPGDSVHPGSRESDPGAIGSLDWR